MFRALFKGIFWLAEKILSWFALVAAFISVGWQGHLMERILGGLISLYATTKGFILAYHHNEMFDEVWSRFTDAFEARLQAAGTNIDADPQMVLVAFVLTLICYKLAAWILRLARKGMGGRKTPKVKKQKIKKDKKDKSNAYEQLYRPPEVSPTTSDYLDKAEEPPYTPPTWKPGGES